MPNRFGLRVEEWPEADRAAWERAFASHDFFNTEALAAHWRPKSRDQVRYAYGRWLAYLMAIGADLTQTSPAQRATPVAVRHYTQHLLGRIKTMSVAAELQHLLLALSVIAPREDWHWLRAQQYAVSKQARRRDHRSKMVDPRRLMDLGMALMDAAAQAPRKGEGARQFRDGLLIALLAARPLRRGSVTALTIGDSVQRVADGYVLVVHEDDTKTGTPIEFDVPAALASYVDRYLAEFRPRFPKAATSNGLWLSSKGGALGAEAIYDLVCRRTKEAFGFAVHPHLFRDIAATTIAREAPGKLLMARDLLTHAKIDTTDRHYIQARTAEAGRAHAATVCKLRERP